MVRELAENLRVRCHNAEQGSRGRWGRGSRLNSPKRAKSGTKGIQIREEGVGDREARKTECGGSTVMVS